MKVSVVGIPWYHESDYASLRQLFEDGHKLHLTYHEWLEAANSSFERLKSGGTIVEKVYITPDEFSAWGSARGQRLDAKARLDFANESVHLRKHLN
jgi:hypothetical protein